MSDVLVEVRELTPGQRQIGPRETILKSLGERRHDIESAIAEGVRISGEALTKATSADGWKVSEFEVRFGVTLTAETGAIVARAGGEASFEVSVKLTREPKS